MQLPADLRIVAIGGNAGAANAFTPLGAVPVPGAGLRTRVWAVSLYFSGTVQVPTNTYFGVYDAITGVQLLASSAAGFAGRTVDAPGGVAAVVNRAVTAFVQSAVAGITVGVDVYVTTEAV